MSCENFTGHAKGECDCPPNPEPGKCACGCQSTDPLTDEQVGHVARKLIDLIAADALDETAMLLYEAMRNYTPMLPAAKRVMVDAEQELSIRSAGVPSLLYLTLVVEVAG